MRGEFAIIMPRIRGRARGLLGPVAQSPCGLVLLDTTAGVAPVVRDLCAELELYARAAGITTLRVNMDTAPGQGFGQGRGQGRGAAEILSAISALRSRGLQRIAVVCATPPAQATARNVTRFPVVPPPTDSWAALPDGVRVVVGLASAIGSVAEVARGVAVVSAGPVASASVRESAIAPSETPERLGGDATTPAAGGKLPMERDHPAQLAHLLLTLPEGGLEPSARADGRTSLSLAHHNAGGHAAGAGPSRRATRSARAARAAHAPARLGRSARLARR